MNELVLKEMNNEKITYLYQPEGNGGFGEIAYSFASQQASIVLTAQDDENGYYAQKARQKVEECVKKNNLPLKFTQAWY